MKIPIDTPSTIFLLIQEGRVVDYCAVVSCLRIHTIDDCAGFKIAIGYQNEYGEKEVIGILADVAPLAACKIWGITPLYGGTPYSICTRSTPGEFVKHQLSVAHTQGNLDLANLPPTMTIKPT